MGASRGCGAPTGRSWRVLPVVIGRPRRPRMWTTRRAARARILVMRHDPRIVVPSVFTRSDQLDHLRGRSSRRAHRSASSAKRIRGEFRERAGKSPNAFACSSRRRAATDDACGGRPSPTYARSWRASIGPGRAAGIFASASGSSMFSAALSAGLSDRSAENTKADV